MKKHFALAASVIAFSSPLFAQNRYQLDPAHSSARFAVKHMMVSEAHGEFDKVSGTVRYDPKNVGGDKLDPVVPPRVEYKQTGPV